MRSFEAAGRLLSFRSAADELFVSQAAISRQVRELEEMIGKPLFKRLHRRVELTDSGEFLLEGLTASFDQLDARLSKLLEQPAQTTVRVSVEPTFAIEWLVPQLKLFQQLHPDIDVSVEATSQLTEFRLHDAELAIRWSDQNQTWPRTEARHLLDVRVAPALTPELLATGPALLSPGDLDRHTLLHDLDRRYWASWYRAAGLPDVKSRRGPVYVGAGGDIQAAKLGLGVALANPVLNREDLKAGLLVRPFELDVLVGAYWLVAPSFRVLSSPAAVLADWVLEKLAAETGAGIGRIMDGD